MSRLSRRWRRAIPIGGLAWVSFGMLSGSAGATDLNFEVHLSAMIDEPTALVITGFTKVMPVDPPFHAAEIAAQSTAVAVNVMDVNPGEHFLEVSQPGVRRSFRFVLNPDGTVVFDPAPGLQQAGNAIRLSP